MDSNSSLPVGIIGAGPVRLASAAHLKERNQPFLLFEAGNTVVTNILSWKQQFEAKATIDASGTWSSPNPNGSGGVHAIGELENADKIFYGIPDILNTHAERYKNKGVLVVGSGYSSINAILELDKLKEKYPSTEIHWVYCLRPTT